MSAETIPAEVATDLDCIRWYVECLDAVAFKRRAVAGLAEAEGSYNAAMKRLTDRSTRPAEPAAPVAEVKAWLLGDPATGQWIEVDGNRVEYSRGMGTPAHVLASAFQAERARADAAEQRAAVALARAEKAEDWQPIETAPVGKNSVAFMMLSFGPPGDQTVSEGMHFNGRFYAASVFHLLGPSGGRQFVFREHEVRPTHWRPTLAPPRASREAQPATDGGDNG